MIEFDYVDWQKKKCIVQLDTSEKVHLFDQFAFKFFVSSILGKKGYQQSIQKYSQELISTNNQANVYKCSVKT